MPLTETAERQYRMPRARTGLRVMYALLALLGVVFVIGYRADHGSTPLLLLLVCAGVLVGFVAWDRRLAREVGLDEVEEGFVDRHSLGSRMLQLEDINRFDHRRRGTFDQVLAILRDGRALPIVGLQEGQRVVWRDGETRSIVTVLNPRREERRAATDPGA